MKIFRNVKTLFTLMLSLEQARGRWHSQREFFWGPNIFTFSELKYFVWDNTSQSTKRQKCWKFDANGAPWLRLCPRATYLALSSARGHNVGDPCCKRL